MVQPSQPVVCAECKFGPWVERGSLADALVAAGGDRDHDGSGCFVHLQSCGGRTLGPMCQHFGTPTLRKLREGWGTHLSGLGDRLKTLAIRLELLSGSG